MGVIDLESDLKCIGGWIVEIGIDTITWVYIAFSGEAADCGRGDRRAA